MPLSLSLMVLSALQREIQPLAPSLVSLLFCLCLMGTFVSFLMHQPKPHHGYIKVSELNRNRLCLAILISDSCSIRGIGTEVQCHPVFSGLLQCGQKSFKAYKKQISYCFTPLSGYNHSVILKVPLMLDCGLKKEKTKIAVGKTQVLLILHNN